MYFSQQQWFYYLEWEFYKIFSSLSLKIYSWMIAMKQQP